MKVSLISCKPAQLPLIRALEDSRKSYNQGKDQGSKLYNSFTLSWGSAKKKLWLTRQKPSQGPPRPGTPEPHVPPPNTRDSVPANILQQERKHQADLKRP